MTDQTQGESPSTSLTTQPQAPRPPIVSGATVAAIVPTTFEDAFRLGTAFFRAGMAPKSLNTPEGATGAILAGMEIGLTPYAALQSFANINGRTTLWGDAIPALLWSHGFKIKEWFENSDPSYPDTMVAKCRVTRPDGEEIEREFSVADGKEAKLFDIKDGPWKTAKKRMLQMRARAFSARDGASDVLRGIPIYEEVADYVDIDQSAPQRGKRDLKGKLQSPKPADAEPEETLHAQADAAAQEAETELVEQEPGPQTNAPVQAAEGASDGKGSADPASTASAVETTAAAASTDEDDANAWASVADITDGFPAKGEAYRLASDEAVDGRVPVYKDGAQFTTAGEKGGKMRKVYRAHAPAEPAETAQESPPAAATVVEAQVEPEIEGGGEEAPTGFLHEVRAMTDWPSIKKAYVAMTKDPSWAEGSDEDKDIVLATLTGIIEDLDVPPSENEDPTFFTIWIFGQEGDEGADAVDVALQTLESAPKFMGLSDDGKERVRAKAEAQAKRLRGEG